MKRFVLALLALSVVSHGAAAPCGKSYFPVGGGSWSPFELPVGQPKSVISKTVDSKNVMQTWDELQIKAGQFTRTIYDLSGFMNKNTITAIIKDGRFTSVQQTITSDTKLDIESQGELAKKALDKLTVTSSNSVRGPIKVVYDQQGRITSASFKLISVRDPKDYSFDCKFSGAQQVIETTGVSDGKFVNQISLDSKGIPAREVMWFLKRPKETFTTTYSPRDGRGEIKFEIMNFEGTKIETGAIQLDQKGRVTKITTQSGTSVQEHSWAYDERNNWTNYQYKYDGRIETTTRVITY